MSRFRFLTKKRGKKYSKENIERASDFSAPKMQIILSRLLKLTADRQIKFRLRYEDGQVSDVDIKRRPRN